jgi:DNA polymerase/3'-5' exonuclease PolX
MLFAGQTLFFDEKFRNNVVSKLQYTQALKIWKINGGSVTQCFADSTAILTSRINFWTESIRTQGVNISVIDANFIGNAISNSRADFPVLTTPKKRANEESLLKRAKQKYSCSSNSQILPDNRKNVVLSRCFEQLLEKYFAEGDKHRVDTYKKVISSLRKVDFEIKSRKDVAHLNGFGEGTLKKVEEILQTGGLSLLDSYQNSEKFPENQIKSLFQKIHGIGPSLAEKFYQQGCRSLADLEIRKDLTDQQKVGLLYYEDFSLKISRDTVEKIANIVKREASELNPSCFSEVMGSFRRGAQMCNDIDMLFYPGVEDEELPQKFLLRLVNRLKKIGLVICDLSLSSLRYHGVCALPGDPRRRIDFLIASRMEKGAALMHFTGNELFNRSIRLLANSKGYSLSQHGLCKIEVQDGRESKIFVAGETEQSIFDALDIPYRPPHERNT